MAEARCPYCGAVLHAEGAIACATCGRKWDKTFEEWDRSRDRWEVICAITCICAVIPALLIGIRHVKEFAAAPPPLTWSQLSQSQGGGSVPFSPVWNERILQYTHAYWLGLVLDVALNPVAWVAIGLVVLIK